jgi:hypothetical protein
MSAMPSTTYHLTRPSLGRWITIGFLAGAAAVLIFHQGAVALMNVLGLTERVPYVTQPTQPFGVPQFWSLTFWGGVWGVVFAALLRHLDGGRLVVASLLLGAVLPTLVAWFFVAPLKGQPAAAGYVPMAMAFGVIVNGAWGLGTGLGLALFGRQRSTTERRQAMRDRRSAERRRLVAMQH